MPKNRNVPPQLHPGGDPSVSPEQQALEDAIAESLGKPENAEVNFEFFAPRFTMKLTPGSRFPHPQKLEALRDLLEQLDNAADDTVYEDSLAALASLIGVSAAQLGLAVPDVSTGHADLLKAKDPARFQGVSDKDRELGPALELARRIEAQGRRNPEVAQGLHGADTLVAHSVAIHCASCRAPCRRPFASQSLNSCRIIAESAVHVGLSVCLCAVGDLGAPRYRDCEHHN